MESEKNREEVDLLALMKGLFRQVSISKSPPRFDLYIEEIIRLEKDINDLGSPWNYDSITEIQKRNKTEYWIRKTLYSQQALIDILRRLNKKLPFFDSGLLISSYDIKNQTLDEQDVSYETIQEKLNEMFSVENEDQIHSYLNGTAISYYGAISDFLLNNFVKPIFENLKIHKKIPLQINSEFKGDNQDLTSQCSDYFKLQAVKIFLYNQNYDLLFPLLEDIDIELRNAISKENYYIKKHSLHYFLDRSNVQCKSLDLSDFYNKVAYLLHRRMFLIQLISIRLIAKDELSQIFKQLNNSDNE